jgi:glycosyltransferase involved in cell wall biosynthesis
MLVSSLRLLYVGPYNSPHFEDLALAMKDRGHLVRATGAPWGGGLPKDNLTKKGVRVDALPPRATLALRRLVRDFRPDVVHAHWMPFVTLAALVGARPLVASAWGSDVYGGGIRRRLSIRFALRRTAVAMSDSQDLTNRLRELGPRSLRTMVVNWGVDLVDVRPPTAEERGRLKERFGLKQGPVVLSARGLKDLYNPELVVEAFSRVRAAVPEAQLVVKHTSPEEAVPADWRAEPGLHLVGRLSSEEMRDLLRAAEVTVSVASSDSSPRSVWEAMAAGSAVVVSDLPWVHELIRNGRDAEVVALVADLVAAAIERLLADASYRQELVAAARRLVEEHRDRDAELTRLEACYRELAASR